MSSSIDFVHIGLLMLLIAMSAMSLAVLYTINTKKCPAPPPAPPAPVAPAAPTPISPQHAGRFKDPPPIVEAIPPQPTDPAMDKPGWTLPFAPSPKSGECDVPMIGQEPAKAIPPTTTSDTPIDAADGVLMGGQYAPLKA